MAPIRQNKYTLLASPIYETVWARNSNPSTGIYGTSTLSQELKANKPQETTDEQIDILLKKLLTCLKKYY